MRAAEGAEPSAARATSANACEPLRAKNRTSPAGIEFPPVSRILRTPDSAIFSRAHLDVATPTPSSERRLDSKSFEKWKTQARVGLPSNPVIFCWPKRRPADQKSPATSTWKLRLWKEWTLSA